jgi:hypothetical protein
MKGKSTRYLFSIFAAILLMGFASSPLNTFSVVVNQSEVVLTWNVNDLSGIEKFEVHRKWRSNSFERIPDADVVVDETLRQNPPSQFEFVDNSLYKTANIEDVEYVLRIRMTNGQSFETHRNVQFTTSAVRRTWGSIKSMFQ